MENLKGKLVFIQTAGGESIIPSSGIIGVLEEIGEEYLRVKDAGIFALVPTTKGAQATSCHLIQLQTNLWKLL